MIPTKPKTTLSAKKGITSTTQTLNKQANNKSTKSVQSSNGNGQNLSVKGEVKAVQAQTKITNSTKVVSKVTVTSINEKEGTKKIIGELPQSIQQIKNDDNIIKQEQQNQLNDVSNTNLQIYQNNIKFYEAFQDQTIFKILSFCSLKDLVKFATLSRQSRKLIPPFIQQVGISKWLQYINEQAQKNEKDYNSMYNLFQIQRQFHKLKNKEESNKLQQFLKDFKKKDFNSKQDVIQILQVGVSVVLNTLKKNDDAIKHIQEKGVFEVFNSITHNQIKPITIQLKTPDYFYQQDTPIYELANIVQQYSKLVIETKIPPKVQKDMMRVAIRSYHYNTLDRLSNSLLRCYQKSIVYIDKEKNALMYLNKNIISKIMPFLNLKELNNLLKSNKQLKSIATQGLESKVQALKEKREQIIKELHLDNKFIQMIIYLLHFKWYESIQHGVIKQNSLFSENIGDAYLVLLNLHNEESSHIENAFKEGKMRKAFFIKHSIERFNANKVNQVTSYLLKYNDKFIEDSKPFCNNSCYLQKYLKGIEMFLQSNSKFDQMNELTDVYLKYLFEIDRFIYQYSKFCNHKIEVLNIYFNQRIENFQVYPHKEPTHRLFTSSEQ